MLLNNSERFGLLLAENMEIGSSRTVESENIGKRALLHIPLLH